MEDLSLHANGQQRTLRPTTTRHVGALPQRTLADRPSHKCQAGRANNTIEVSGEDKLKGGVETHWGAHNVSCGLRLFSCLAVAEVWSRFSLASLPHMHLRKGMRVRYSIPPLHASLVKMALMVLSLLVDCVVELELGEAVEVDGTGAWHHVVAEGAQTRILAVLLRDFFSLR